MSCRVPQGSLIRLRPCCLEGLPEHSGLGSSLATPGCRVPTPEPPTYKAIRSLSSRVSRDRKREKERQRDLIHKTARLPRECSRKYYWKEGGFSAHGLNYNTFFKAVKHQFVNEQPRTDRLANIELCPQAYPKPNNLKALNSKPQVILVLCSACGACGYGLASHLCGSIVASVKPYKGC